MLLKLSSCKSYASLRFSNTGRKSPVYPTRPQPSPSPEGSSLIQDPMPKGLWDFSANTSGVRPSRKQQPTASGMWTSAGRFIPAGKTGTKAASPELAGTVSSCSRRSCCAVGDQTFFLTSSLRPEIIGNGLNYRVEICIQIS